MSARSEVSGAAGTRFSSVLHVSETGSTNADLLEEARQGAPEGLVLVTDHQTAGRGRQARAWHDEPGNSMLMSVLVRPAPTYAALIPLLTGLAVIDGILATIPPSPPRGAAAAGDGAPQPPSQEASTAIAGAAGASGSPPSGAGAAGAARLALKWPNDVLAPGLGERKVAGILAEAATDAGGLAVVVGTGCNLRWTRRPPPEISERAATVEELAGASVERWTIVRSVLRSLDHWLAMAGAEGPGGVLAEYRHRCLTIGREVRFETPTSIVEGRAVAVADDGGLVVDGPSGEVTLRAGDAHHV